MKRTTIMLSAELKSEAVKRARKKGISLGELIRESLESDLKKPIDAAGKDSLLDDRKIFEGKSPRNLAADHDRYLYDDES